MTVHQFTDPLLAALAAAQAEYGFFAPLPATVVVGVSGGADSVCLLHALALLAPHWLLTLHVAHVDHGLRPAAHADAAFVRTLATALHLPFHCLTLAPGELDAMPGGREAAARAVRSRFLHATALAVTPPEQTPHIALAHHAEDQAETLLLHLVQGSGLRGLGAMRPVSRVQPDAAPGEMAPVRVVRPLLHLRRAALRDYLARHHLTWCEDDTNADVAFARNRLRHLVLPQLALLNPAVVDVLGRTADLLAGEAARLDRLDAAQLDRLVLAPPTTERIVLDVEQWRRLPAADQRSVLRRALAPLADARGSGGGAPRPSPLAPPLAPPPRELGFQQLERLRTQLAAVAGASGPHPIAAGIAWSVASARRAPHLQLSLHCVDALPFPPDHPFLGATWREVQGCLPLSPGVAPLVGDWRLTCTLLRARELPPDWQQNPDPWRAYVDAATVAAPCLTTPHPGLRVAPLGMGGHTRVLGDLFTDRKTPASLRAGWPLVIDAATGQVLWVCGLQPAHVGRVTATTQTVLCLAWQPHQE